MTTSQDKVEKSNEPVPVTDKTEEAAKKFMEELNNTRQQLDNELTKAEWKCSTQLTEDNINKKVDTLKRVAAKVRENWGNLKRYDWSKFKDGNLRRQFKLYSIIGEWALSDKKFYNYTRILSDMEKIYGKARICSFSDAVAHKEDAECNLSLDPELTNIMANCRDPLELRYVWREWRNVTGKRVRALFEDYVILTKEIAELNGHRDMSEIWMEEFEDPKFMEHIEQLWSQIRPLYLQLHAYVRRKLREKYGKEVSSKGSIPAHLLGDMWAENWGNIYEITLPFPDKKPVDITEEMVQQGYTPLKMFQYAEDFYVSMDLDPMPKSFWEKSVLEKPNDGRDMICHAAAYDFSDGEDFRIKQCTKVNQEDFKKAHHEMGHIQYFLHYKNQPTVFRRGANSGFHEAVGDVIGLSFSTTKHLKRIGLMKEDEEPDKEKTLNHLYKICLEKVASLPYAYIMDLWRWNVFNGKISPKKYNLDWWRLRESYQGVSAPVQRTEDHFDIGSKYHTIASVPYIRYFVSSIVQFQFHKALCEIAGEYDSNNPEKPLHEAEIYGSVEAGAALKMMMRLGKSKHWQCAMEEVTGSKKMDAKPLLEYFQPIYEFFVKDNAEHKEYIGWNTDMDWYGACPCHTYQRECNTK